MSRRTRRESQRSAPSPSRPAPGRDSWPDAPTPTSTGTARIEPDRDRANAATLYVNEAPSSYVDLDDPEFLAFEYMQDMAAAIGLLPDGPLRAVHLGAAGCSMARYLDRVRPDSRQLGIDLDARLIELVRDWFDLPRAPRLRLRAGEARTELRRLAAGRSDVIVRDVFAGDTTPEHLTTVGFAAEASAALAPTGLYLANVADRPPLRATRAEVAALAEAWGPDPWDRLALITEPAILKGRRYGNVVLMATGPAGIVPGRTDLARRLRSLPVPAHMVTGDELADFVGSTPPRRDPDDAPTGRAPAGR